jgi:hypothetical protein
MHKLKLDSDSVVLVISTEGDTDVKHYREVVWEGKHPARSSRLINIPPAGGTPYSELENILMAKQIPFNAILEKSKQYEKEMTRFLRDMIAIPSESSDEKRVVHRIKEEMEKVGFDKVEIDPMGGLHRPRPASGRHGRAH